MKNWREGQALQDKVRQSGELFRTIIETAPDNIWTLDHLGNFNFMNKRGEETFGYKASGWRGKNITGLIHPEDLSKAQECLLNISKVESYCCELKMNAKDGQVLILSVNVVPLYKDDKIIGTGWFGRDITEHRRAEKALHESEERYRILVETMNEGLVEINGNGLLTYVNDQVCQRSEYSRGELIGRPVTDFLDESGKNTLIEQMGKRKRGEHEPYEISTIRKDGQQVFVLISPKPIFDENGQLKSSFAVLTDITKRKRVEEALRESEKQLRHLSSQLLTAQETERKRISRELHDELGQALAVLKLKVSFIQGGLHQDQTAIREECQNTLHYMDQVIENVRRLSWDLSPTILEDLGLRAALLRLINNIMINNHAKVTFEMEDIDPLLSQNAQIIIYRIFQEAFTNVAKHAAARNISVLIKKGKDQVSFRVEDDGQGFDVGKVARRDPMEKGLGLATMEERVRMLGGALDLWSQEGKGTRLTFDIPMKKGRIL